MDTTTDTTDTTDTARRYRTFDVSFHFGTRMWETRVRILRDSAAREQEVVDRAIRRIWGREAVYGWGHIGYRSPSDHGIDVITPLDQTDPWVVIERTGDQSDLDPLDEY